MKWFQGTIVEAVTQSKAKQALFVVFVRGPDPLSTKMDNILESPDIELKLPTDVVAVKVDSETDTCKMFADIYPVLIIPSLFFIGVDGAPIEVIGGCPDQSVFDIKLKNVTKLFGKPPPESSAIGVDHPAPKANVEATGSDTSDSKPEAVTEAAEKVDQPVVETTSSNAELPEPVNESVTPVEENPAVAPLEDRVERAKKLLEEKRKQKQDEEAEKEKEEERKRREMGQLLVQMKRDKDEKERKELADDLERRRREEKESLASIRAQIERDRAERQAAYEQQKRESQQRSLEAEHARLEEEQRKAAIEAAKKSSIARLQFRLPDGRLVTHMFDADTLFSEIVEYVRNEVQPPFPHFTLSLACPRREFNETDYTQSLRDLALLPSAAILVLPSRYSSTSRPSSAIVPAGISNFFWMILSPFMVIIRMVLGIFGFSSGENKQTRPRSPPPRQGSSNIPSTTDSRISRQDGRFHRLVNRNDGDENSTWNGNSTQQL